MHVHTRMWAPVKNESVSGKLCFRGVVPFLGAMFCAMVWNYCVPMLQAICRRFAGTICAGCVRAPARVWNRKLFIGRGALRQMLRSQTQRGNLARHPSSSEYASRTTLCVSSGPYQTAFRARRNSAGSHHVLRRMGFQQLACDKPYSKILPPN